MTLLETLLGVGLLAGGVVSGIVYVDSAWRGMPVSTRLGRALAAGGGSFGGFLVPLVGSQQLQYLYFQVLKSRPVAGSPGEWRSVSLTTGFVLTVVLVGLYLVGSRLQARKRAD